MVLLTSFLLLINRDKSSLKRVQVQRNNWKCPTPPYSGVYGGLDGLMVSVLNSGLIEWSGALRKALNFHSVFLHPGVQMGTGELNAE